MGAALPEHEYPPPLMQPATVGSAEQVSPSVVVPVVAVTLQPATLASSRTALAYIDLLSAMVIEVIDTMGRPPLPSTCMRTDKPFST